MVGPAPRAPPRRWTSAHMRGPDERRRVDGQPSRPGRVGRERRRSPCRDLAQGGLDRERADDREEPPGPDRPRPPPQAGPAGRGGRAHRGERAHAPADLGGCVLGNAPERQRQCDSTGRVQAVPQQSAGHHDHHRAAGLALVPPDQDPDQIRQPVRRGWAPLVPLTQAVPMEPQRPTRWAPSGTADRAPAWSGHLHARGISDPPLDVERAVYDSTLAPVACFHRPGARRGACSNTLPVTRFRGRRRAGAPSSPASIPSPGLSASRRPT